MHITVDDQDLHDELTMLLKRVSPSGRRAIAKEIAMAIRTHRSNSIKANIDPDGQPFEPRKPQKRKKAKKGRMFKKLSARRSMLAKYSAAEAKIAFLGKNIGIAEVHQEGGLGVVNDKGLKVRYPKRKLMGIGHKEREIVRESIINALANGAHRAH